MTIFTPQSIVRHPGAFLAGIQGMRYGKHSIGFLDACCGHAGMTIAS